MGVVISKIIKPIEFFSRILIKPQHNYTTTEKELLTVVERLNQLRGIIFVYGINIFSYNRNLLYAATLIEYKRLVRWLLVFEYFGPNIQHKSGVGNIVADTLSRLPSTSVKKYNPITSKSQCCDNELFAIGKGRTTKIVSHQFS